MVYQAYAPDAPVLTDALDAMFYLKGYAPEHGIERLVPDAKLSIVIELDGQERHIYDNASHQPVQSCTRAWVSGMQTGYISISALQQTELLAIQFKPGTAHPFLKSRLDALQDKVVPAGDVFGEGIYALRKQIKAAPEPVDKLETAAQWLLVQYDDGRQTNKAVSDALAQIIANPVAPTLKEIMVQSAYSKKHFIDLFKKYVGLSPKALQRVLRFAEVMALVQDEKSIQWAQVSLDCGYYDQSHFIKDFLHFSGFNPQAFLDEDHDRPNFFPVD
ncbi:MAG: AraC family transcriptional regulator [Bacteroidota bacterium]